MKFNIDKNELVIRARANSIAARSATSTAQCDELLQDAQRISDEAAFTVLHISDKKLPESWKKFAKKVANTTTQLHNELKEIIS